MRYDATTPRSYKDRDGNDKTNWTRIGAAFEKDGRITVLLDALPLPDATGVCKIILMEPRQQEGRQVQNNARPTGREQREFRGASRQDDLEDGIPF